VALGDTTGTSLITVKTNFFQVATKGCSASLEGSRSLQGMRNTGSSVGSDKLDKRTIDNRANVSIIDN
jgi:hypothetical protein